eukprot:1143883-Pelagomonas_calceolata.AAC.9
MSKKGREACLQASQLKSSLSPPRQCPKQKEARQNCVNTARIAAHAHPLCRGPHKRLWACGANIHSGKPKPALPLEQASSHKPSLGLTSSNCWPSPWQRPNHKGGKATKCQHSAHCCARTPTLSWQPQALIRPH